jgi:hypothetical protein
MVNIMNDKRGILIGSIVAGLVILTLTFYLLNIKNIGVRDLIEVCIVFILVGLALFIIWDKIRNIQKGLATKDERVITISYKAGYYGFIAAIWTVVFSSVAIDILFSHELTGSELAGVTVIISGFVFAVSFLYLSRKGN